MACHAVDMHTTDAFEEDHGGRENDVIHDSSMLDRNVSVNTDAYEPTAPDETIINDNDADMGVDEIQDIHTTDMLCPYQETRS